MSNTNPLPRGPGRPREFDRETVLDAVVQLFWTEGYEATSMSEIVDATGLSKSSLYGAFGSKHDLLDTALNRYLKGVFGQFLASFADSTEGLADVHRFVDAYHKWLLDDAAGRGCLAVNAANQLGYSDDMVSRYAAEYRLTLREALRAPLERAAELGEIDSSAIEAAVEQMLALALAASVFSRSRSDAGELERLADVSHKVIDAWMRDT